MMRARSSIAFLPLVLLLLCNVGDVSGRSFLPQSFVDKYTLWSSTNDRDLQDCPAALDPAACVFPLDTIDKWQTCAASCAAAACCQTDCQSCAQCFSYTPCLNLGDPPGDGSGGGDGTSNSTCEILSVDYYQGYNLHFSLTFTQAMELMPYSAFSPMKLSIVDEMYGEGEDKKKSKKNNRLLRTRGSKKSNKSGSRDKESYYISFHATKIGVKVGGMNVQVSRADLFTYAIDPNGEFSLVIVAAYLEVPQPFQQSNDLLMGYKQAIVDLALDSRTGEPAYPHIFAFNFPITNQGFSISGGDLGQEARIQIEISQDCSEEANSQSFSRDFILANSIAYRSPTDKNINYFNKEFIAAEVKTFSSDFCIPIHDIDFLLASLPSDSQLQRVDAYGSPDKAITWQYDDSTISDGTPFLTLMEKEARIDFKKQAFSSIWNGRAGAIANGESETLLKLVLSEGSLYINWEISDVGVDQLSAALNLQALGLSMTPIQILVGESPRYILSLNAYIGTFEGIPGENGEWQTGVRFEYSIYVKKQGNPRPFFMVIEALSSVDSFDPVQGPVSASNITYSPSAGTISLISETWTADVRVKGNMPVPVEKDWIIANDEIYWANGVIDQTFYDTSLTLQVPVKAELEGVSGTFTWAGFLRDPGNPVHAILFEEPIRFVVRPWSNLNSFPPNIPGIEMLKGVKSQVYSGLAQLFAANIASGLQEPLLDVNVYGEYPATPKLAFNFEIHEDMIADLQKVIHLPDEFHIIKMAMSAASVPKYIMTVEFLTQKLVYGGEQFKKAAWTVYVEDKSGQIYSHEFHLEFSQALGFDIENILKEPAEVFEFSETNGSLLDVSIENGPFEAHFTIPSEPTAGKIGVTDSWVNAHAKILWQKGVYDVLYYNGGLLNAQLIPIDSSKAQVSQVTPWSAFVKESPFESFLFDSDITFVSASWSNIEEI